MIISLVRVPYSHPSSRSTRGPPSIPGHFWWLDVYYWVEGGSRTQELVLGNSFSGNKDRSTGEVQSGRESLWGFGARGEGRRGPLQAENLRSRCPFRTTSVDTYVLSYISNSRTAPLSLYCLQPLTLHFLPVNTTSLSVRKKNESYFPLLLWGTLVILFSLRSGNELQSLVISLIFITISKWPCPHTRSI